MYGLPFQQDWLVIDVTPTPSSTSGKAATNCAASARRHVHACGETRYRWEFRLLAGETAADYTSIAALSR